MREIVLEVWGDFALFSEPAAKVERMTYPFMTPSAARGLLSSIYSKPKEFYWQVNRIEVLRPIQYISFKRNEVKCTVSDKPIFTDEERTQRQSVALKDVRYRIAASIIPRPDCFVGKETQLYEQAFRRIRTGKCYMQPSLGLKEFIAYFEEYDPSVHTDRMVAGIPKAVSEGGRCLFIPVSHYRRTRGSCGYNDAHNGLLSVGGHARVICFDKPAFCSYGLKKAANAPFPRRPFPQ